MSRLRALLGGPGRLHRDESGQAMVEFVLVFPIQLVLSLCVLQFAFIAHAHLVVEQAAFMGARAAAVADAGLERGFLDSGWRPAANKAAKRVAARTCAVLTSAAPPASPATIDDEDRRAMRWFGEGRGHELGDARVQEAFKHIDVQVLPRPDDGYVGCVVTYDYVMVIPVANHIFAQAQMKFGLGTITDGDPYNGPSQQRQRTCFRVQQVSFISTPWTRGPR